MCSDYIGFPRTDAERKLSALPMSVLLKYAAYVQSNSLVLERVMTSWDLSFTSCWTDEQYAQLALIEEEQGEIFLSSEGYEGLYARHSIALAKVDKVIFKYNQNPMGSLEEIIQEELRESPYVLENY